jgi:hypothetical protein
VERNSAFDGMPRVGALTTDQFVFDQHDGLATLD